MVLFDRVSEQSNLDNFLHFTTPVTQSQFLPKSEIRNLNHLWHPWEREQVEYFTLEDLWNCYDEWSAYGAGVPIELSSGETLVQYYVPYLSAIQIFTTTSTVNSLRELEPESEGSEEGGSEKLWRWEGCSSDDGGFESDNNLWHLNDRLGCLYFEYFEELRPHYRVPLTDKIKELGQRHRGLMSLRSVDLSPASWMAVAWYPIYHIPMGRTVKDLSTCFLTYHTLSSSFQDMEGEGDQYMSRDKKICEGISVPAFGLATFKMRGATWVSGNNGRDQERLLSLLGVADSWLKQLRAQHHDFNYFLGFHCG